MNGKQETKKQKAERERLEAVENIKALFSPARMVYTTRNAETTRQGDYAESLRLYILVDNLPVNITTPVAVALGVKLDRWYGITSRSNGYVSCSACLVGSLTEALYGYDTLNRPVLSYDSLFTS